MTRANKVRAVIALAVLAFSALLTATTPPNLGIDLKGGTRIVLETRDTAKADATAHTTDRTMEVLRQRIDGLGVTEPELVRSGDNRILVDLPGVDDPTEAAEVLGRTASLSFHPVEGPADAAKTKDKDGSDEGKPQGSAADGDETDGRALRDESGQALQLDAAELTGAEVAQAKAAVDPERGGWFVELGLRDGGKDAWADVTGEAACAPEGDPARRVAVVLDNKIISSPQIDPSVACGRGITQGTTQITGSFSEAEAKELAALIEGGALPVPVDVVEHRTVGPTLGARAITASAEAAVLGAALTAAFVIIVYRVAGLLAVIGLLSYTLIAYAGLLAFDATLTLPGLAGFVLAIGMAVDANVLVLERAREAYGGDEGRKRSLRSALTKGFKGALSAVIDSNVTTLLAAGLLFFLAAGPVRGFGVTLSLGVVASMVSALVVARILTDLAAGSRWLRARPAFSGIAARGRLRAKWERSSPDWMRHGRRWLVVSGLALAVAVTGLFARGLEFGVDFTGGRIVEYTTEQSVEPDRARQALERAGISDAVVQSSDDGGEKVSVRTEKLTAEQEKAVDDTVDELGGGADRVRDELIGPSIGEELRRNALVAIGVALCAQFAYLAARFRWSFAAAAITALLHDVVIVAGVFAWLGMSVDGVFLAALLTVVGYSVNDSVVVFDRVRTEWATDRAGRLRSIVNKAVVRTMPRTMNTGMGTLFIAGSLALLGGDSLQDFAVALLVGIVAGSYSSLFVAAPLAIELEQIGGAPKPPAPKEPAERKRRVRGPADTGARV